MTILIVELITIIMTIDHDLLEFVECDVMRIQALRILQHLEDIRGVRALYMINLRAYSYLSYDLQLSILHLLQLQLRLTQVLLDLFIIILRSTYLRRW